MKKYSVLGLMSGTSLDGLDVAHCLFSKNRNGWQAKIVSGKTFPYSSNWVSKLRGATRLTPVELNKLSQEYGEYLGERVNIYKAKHKIKVSYIASHGHTVFHQPAKKITVQIGDGKRIANTCGLPVVYDFRTGDVKLGGQGAPLVPIADQILFSSYAYCLNLGGIANVSYENDKRQRIAFDICPVNIVLNELASEVGKEYDEGGKLAAKGRVDRKLLERLNTLGYYKLNHPKSLGREWIEQNFFPVLKRAKCSVTDKLRTVVEHVAQQIANAVSGGANTGNEQLLITGGGAFNTFLVNRIKAHVQLKVALPNKKLIKFKESLAFALLGVLRIERDINILKSVTGATRNSCGGKLFLPRLKMHRR